MVQAVPAHENQHKTRHQQPEDDDDDVDGQAEPEHQAVDGQHQQDIQLFIEVLNGNRMAS